MGYDPTFPSDVTAANTVAEYGAHAKSPTTLLRSYENMGLLVDNHHEECNKTTCIIIIQKHTFWYDPIS